MEIKLKIVIAVAFLYGLFELFMSLIQRLKRKRKRIKRGDRLSIWVLMLSILIGYFLSFSIASAKYGRIDHWIICIIIGSVLILIGLTIRVNSILTLNQYFTYSVSEVENHELIEKGMYKIIRHPGYLGQLVILSGISISLSNWLSVLSMIVPVFLGYLNRIRIEEAFMVVQMGEKYKAYQKKTNRLIPKVY